MEDRDQEFIIPADEFLLKPEFVDLPHEFDTTDVPFPEREHKNVKKMMLLVSSLLAAVGINFGLMADTAQPAMKYDSAGEIQAKAEDITSEETPYAPLLITNEGGKCRIVIYNDPPDTGKREGRKIIADMLLDETELVSFTLPTPGDMNQYSHYSFEGWCVYCRDENFMFMLDERGLDADNIPRLPVENGVRYIELHPMWTIINKD